MDLRGREDGIRKGRIKKGEKGGNEKGEKGKGYKGEKNKAGKERNGDRPHGNFSESALMSIDLLRLR